MSEKKSPPRKEKASCSLQSIVKTPQSTSKTESGKLLKRKLFSPSGINTADEEEKKGSIPKRRRSFHADAGSPPPVSSISSSANNPLVTSSKTPGRQAPLSERQQIAKIMQQYAAEETQHGELSPRHPSASPPHSAGKRTPFDKKMNKRNEKGETMLHVAAIRGDLKMTKRLIKAGADVNVKDNAGWTPLHEACNHGHFNIAKQLLKNRANVNVLGLENDTPLHDASVNGHVKLIQLLLRHGANPLQSNMAGKAPVDVARDDTILKLLKSETIASSSGSESVTSEVRSPTSPDSNLSEDEDDPKRRKESSEPLFMPRSTTMISSIGAAAAASSSHSPTSTTTPTKPPISDPYAYHEETETDLPTGPTPSSSTTPSRSHVFKNIHVSHKMGDSQPRLTMVFTHNKTRQEQRGTSSVHSPKRSAGSQIHHDEPKKQKLFGGGLYGDKHSGEKGKSKYSVFDSHIGSTVSQRSHSPAADSQSSQDSDLYDPKLGGTSDSNKFIGTKKTDSTFNQPSSSHSKVSSSDNGNKNEITSTKSHKKDSEAAPKNPKKDGEPSQKYYKRDSEAVPKKKESDPVTKSSKKESDLFLTKSAKKESIVDTSFQPDSQMPILSQDGFSPVQFDMNFDDVSDSDDNPLQIDVDSTTTPSKPSERSSKHIPTSSVSSVFQGPYKSDVTSSNTVDTKDKAKHSPQSAGSASPYHFSDSPCSLTSFSYKHTDRSEKKQHQEASSSSSSLTSLTNFKSDKVVDKYGSKASKNDKSKQKESHHYSPHTSDAVRHFGVVSQSDVSKREVSSSDNIQKLSSSIGKSQTLGIKTSGAGSKNVTSSVTGSKNVSSSATAGSKSLTTGNTRSTSAAISSSNINSSGGNVKSLNTGGSDMKGSSTSNKTESHSPKVDTTSTSDIKPAIKVEVKEEPQFTGLSSTSTDFVAESHKQSPGTSCIKEEKVDLKPLSIKVEKERTMKLERDGERSKSPKGVDKDSSSRKNSPKLYDAASNRSSPRPFLFNSGNGNGSKNGTTPKWDTNRASPKSDRDSPKSDRSDRSDCSSSTPKVPPLKIIIPPKGTQAVMDRPQHHAKTQQQKATALPYVLNPTQENPDSSVMVATTTTTSTAPSSEQTPIVGLVKSSRNSSRASSIASGELDVSEKNSTVGGGSEDKESNQGGGVTSTQEPSMSVRRNTRSKNIERDVPKPLDEESGDSSKPDTRSEAGGEQQKEEQSERRVTRSQMRSQQGKEKKGNGGMIDNNRENNGSNKDEKEDKEAATAGQDKDSSSNKAAVQNCNSDEIAVHPRKRKALRQRHTQEQSTTVDASFSFFPKNNTNEKTANPYEMYLDIRKKVAKRRTEMTVVTPKAPTGFSNYLMVSCNYVLQGTSASKLNIQMLTPPNSLQDSMKELFKEQEKARYKLRLQHLIEREKLRLSIEQEVLRVHGRAARALANQTTPLSMCAILRDEEIYNTIDPEAEEKEKIGARSRYNGRQFLSWLQDVDDKYEKIKESLLLRHHHEAESLHAVQKLEWEWKLKENTYCDNRTAPSIENLHVPMVTVNDEFELLPS